MLHFLEIWFFVLCHLLVLLRAEVDMPFLSIQAVPSKMKLDDLIRTSLMVMAVARAGEQQSVIRCIVHWIYSNIFRLYLMRIPLNRQRSCTSARHGGTWSSPPLSFQHSHNQEAHQGWSNLHLLVWLTYSWKCKMGESAWPLRPKMAHILNRSLLL